MQQGWGFDGGDKTHQLATDQKVDKKKEAFWEAAN